MHSAHGRSDKHHHHTAKYIDPSSALDSAVHKDIHFELAKNFIDQHGKLIQGPVLEIGSGDGKLTAYIANKFAINIVGLDVSEEKVAMAKQEYGNNYHIHFVAGDAVRMHYQPEITKIKYGTIVSFNALHHVPANMHYVLYANIRRMLQPDGRVLFLVPGRCADLHDVIEEVTKTEKWKAHFHDFDFSRMRTYEATDYYQLHFQRSRFYHCETTQEVLDGGIDLDFEGMKRYLRGWLPHLEHLQMIHHNDPALEELSEQLLHDIVTGYFQCMNKDLKGTVHPRITLNKIIAYVSEQSFFASRKSEGTGEAPCDEHALQAKL